MWIFLNNSFLSLVEDRTNPKNLLVRARVRGDIERVFPGAKAIHTPVRADYAWRASIDRTTAAVTIKSQVDKIDYTNFKDSVVEDDRHDAYVAVWTTMYGFQRKGGRSRRLDLKRTTR